MIKIKQIIRSIYFFLFFTGTVVLLLHGCKKDPVRRDFPRVVTTGVTDITMGEAVFCGEILTLGREQITDHGFLYRRSDSPPDDSSHWNVIQMGTAGKTGPFSVKVTSGINRPGHYQVYAYALSNTYTVVGNIIFFTMPQLPPPVIASVDLMSGTWRDTLTIKGKYFDETGDFNEVKFDMATANIIYSSDTLLKTVIPDDVTKEQVTVTLSVYGRSVSYPKKFIMKKPRIDKISPDSGFHTNTVSILGDYFSPRENYNEAVVGTMFSTITYADRHRVDIILPGDLTNGWHDIKLRCQMFHVSRDHAIYITAPFLEKIHPDRGTFSDTVVLTGKFFHTELENKMVLVGNAAAPILSYTDTLIRFTIPYFTYQQFAEIALSLEHSYFPLERQKFELVPPVITDVTPTTLDIGDDFIIRGKNFNPVARFNHVVSNGKDRIAESNSNATTIYSRIYPDISAPDGRVTIAVYTLPELKATWTGHLTIYAPHIDRIMEDAATIGDQVTITGDHFNKYGSNSVHIGGINIYDVSLVSKTSLSFFVPEKTPVSATTYVVTNDQKSNEVLFALKKISISDVSPRTITQGTTVTITGENFSSWQRYNKVSLSILNNPVTLISSSRTEVKFKVPDGNFQEGPVTLTLQVGEQQVVMTDYLTYSNK